MKYENLMTGIFILPIRIYQTLLSPILKHWISCRFHPTCSEYAIQSIKKYGVRLGMKKSYHRLLRCNRYNLDSCIDLP